MTEESVRNVAEAEPSPKVSYRKVLAERNFALLWSGQSLSNIGNQVFPVALAFLVLQQGGSDIRLGIVLGAQALAVVIGLFAAAAIGDRWRRTRMMITADVMRAVTIAVIAILGTHIGVALLLVMIAVEGIGEGLFQPAFGAIVPRVLPRSHLQPGNGLVGFSTQLSQVIGPAVAGALIAWHGTVVALWLDEITFLASLGTLLAITEFAEASTEQPAVPQSLFGGLRRDLQEGFRAVRARPWIGAGIVIATAIMAFAVAPSLVALPIQARRTLGGARAYGTILAALGVGSMLGSLLVGRWSRGRRGVVAVIGLCTLAASFLGLALLPLPGVIITWFASGFGLAFFQITWMTCLQRDVPDALLGRVMALDWVGSQGLMPIGFALAGPVIAAVGTRAVLLAGAVLVIVTAPMLLFVPGGTDFSTPAREPA